MSNRTTIIILAIAAALVGFIYLFERDSMTTGERAERDDRVFSEFRRDRVSAFTVKGTGGVQISLERVRPADDGGEEHWKIGSPRELEADGSEVRALLAAVDFLIAERTVTGEGNRKDARFGLTSPRLEGSFTSGDVTTRFGVGADAQGEKVYLGVDGEDDRFYAVDKAFLESLDKSLDDLRSKKLVGADLADPSRLEIRRGETTTRLRQSAAGPWQIERSGSWILAAEDQVGEIVRAVADLRAESFVADGVSGKELAAHGFGEGALRLTASPEKGEPVTVLVGNPCPGGEHQLKATVDGTGTVACVGDDLLAVLERPAERLEERRPLVFRDDDVTRIILTRGEGSLTLARVEEEWRIEGDESYGVEQKAVADLLGALRETAALEVAPGSEAVASLGEKRGEVVLELTDEGDRRALAFHDAADGEGELVRRAGEDAALRVPAGLREQARPEPLAFRSRRIENGHAHDVDRLGVEGGPATQTLEKKDGAWQVVFPVASAADGTGARKLAELISALDVQRFVASGASAAHGLAPPFASVTARFIDRESNEEGEDRTGSKEVVLELGAPAGDGGRYGRVKGADGAVFVLSREYVAAIGRPLVARDLLQIDDTVLARLTLRAGAAERVFERIESDWKATDGDAVDGERLVRLITDLGSLKAIRPHSFGPAPTGFDTPTLVIESAEKGAADAGVPAVITVGRRTADESEDGYLARLAGLDITFVLPARIVDEAMAMVGTP